MFISVAAPEALEVDEAAKREWVKSTGSGIARYDGLFWIRRMSLLPVDLMAWSVCAVFGLL